MIKYKSNRKIYHGGTVPLNSTYTGYQGKPVNTIPTNPDCPPCPPNPDCPPCPPCPTCPKPDTKPNPNTNPNFESTNNPYRTSTIILGIAGGLTLASKLYSVFGKQEDNRPDISEEINRDFDPVEYRKKQKRWIEDVDAMGNKKEKNLLSNPDYKKGPLGIAYF